MLLRILVQKKRIYWKITGKLSPNSSSKDFLSRRDRTVVYSGKSYYKVGRDLKNIQDIIFEAMNQGGKQYFLYTKAYGALYGKSGRTQIKRFSFPKWSKENTLLTSKKHQFRIRLLR